MSEGPDRLEDVPSEARDSVLATPVEFARDGGLGIQIRAHWEKYRPRMARQLDQAGTLDAAVHTAEALTVSAYEQAIRRGLAPDQARELVREEWAFLPDEDDVRHLAPERDPRHLVNALEKIEGADVARPSADAVSFRGRNLRRRP